jgi:flavin reductase (DIM6/NTAB) family NADH-FMN oxidoreductase RutF
MKEIRPDEFNDAFSLIGKDWMLITAGDERDFNTMTASWGSFGVLWFKNIVTVYIRPSRYTYEFVEKNDYFSLSFFPEGFRETLTFCGKNSGRDINKIQNTGLIPIFFDDIVGYEQARLTIKCRKLYSDIIKPEKFIDKELLSIYKNNDYHTVIHAEIEKVYED